MFQIIIRVLKLLHHKKRTLFSLVSANFIFAILMLVEPIFFKQVIDILVAFDSSNQSDFSGLFSTLLLWLCIGLITIVLKVFITILADRFAHHEFRRNVNWFYNHTQNLWMRFHMDTSSGQLVKKITRGVDGIFRLHLDVFRRITPSIFVIVILIPVVLYFNVKLWLFVIIIGLVSSLITFFIAAKTFKKQSAIEDIYSNMSAHYGDTFSNMSIIKSFSLNRLKNKELSDMMDLRTEKQYPILNWWGAIISFSQVLKIIVSIGVIYFGSYLYFAWEITIWEVVMFLSFSLIFLSAIEDLTWTFESIFWNVAPIEQYFQILDTNLEIQDTPWARNLKNIKWDISFRNVEFSYDGKRKVLQNINIDIKAGEKIAFVGHTGSGKTTMTNMLLRFFEPQSGDILIDKTSIYDVTQDSLRKNIWVVFQDNSLFNTTILENIRLDTKATRKDIERVAIKSHSSDFIKNLSEWLDTVVGERWVKLSWGEKQRLAIARAFLKDAPILILDEATSALDAQTEKYLQSSFDELMSGRTTFIIAHRLSTIMKADRIFVFDQWKIEEQGSYDELMKKKGKFEKLVEAQTKGFIE